MHIYRYILYIVILLIITQCVVRNHKKKNVRILSLYNQVAPSNFNIKNKSNIDNTYDYYIHLYAKKYGVDAGLIKAIIQVESNYNPTVVSKSNAVGLMQLKADTAGKDAYRLKGWSGKPSIYDLKNAVINIDLGTAYVSILQKQLEGVIDIKTRRYAIIVAYVNGLGALLRIFSTDRTHAIEKINKLNSEQFYQYIKYNHPSEQAQRYLSKVDSVYNLKN